MRPIVALFVLFGFFLANSSQAQEIELADVGFSDLNAYIHTEPVDLEGQEAFAFRLATKSLPQKFVPISPCAYLKSGLELAISKADLDPQLRKELRWLIRSGSGYSMTPSSQFYAHLKAILKMVRDCDVREFDDLLREISVGPG
ncbi:MAG: hypothetical protein AB7G93_13570 [Bdellovibrionales bacterium]